MYACVCICMYVCMYENDELRFLRVPELKELCRYVCMCVYMCICMYIYLYVCMYGV